MRNLRIAVVGAGHLGRFHARLVRQIEGVELAAIVDPHQPARRALAEELQAPAVADLGQIDGRLDAAVIAAPTQLHHDIGMRLIRQGVHLLVEKPLAATQNEAEELCAAARRRGLVLQVGHIERFNPAFTAALPHLSTVKYIEASRLSGYSFRSMDIGVVLDLMIHDLDLVLSLVRSPLVHVEACGVSVLGKHEDAAHARLSFACGAVALLRASRVSFSAVRQMQCWTPERFVGIDFASRGVTVVRPAEALLRGQFDPEQVSLDERNRLKDHLFEELLPLERFEAEPRNALADELADFVDAVRTLREPRVGGEDGCRAIAAAEQVLQAIAGHDWAGSRQAAAQPEPILRGPHWNLKAAASRTRQKEAG